MVEHLLSMHEDLCSILSIANISIIKMISLWARTVGQRIEDINSKISFQLKNKNLSYFP